MGSNSWNGVIPSALLESEDYKELNAKEQFNFVARLRYCDEIAVKGAEAAAIQDSELLDAIDDIELDALSIMSLGDIDTQVSPYKIHSSWTFECNRQAMAQLVVADAAKFLGSAPLGMDASSEETKDWLYKWSQAIQSTLKYFAASSSFTEVITHLIVIDALVSSYLVFAATARLNGVTR